MKEKTIAMLRQNNLVLETAMTNEDNVIIRGLANYADTNCPCTEIINSYKSMAKLKNSVIACKDNYYIGVIGFIFEELEKILNFRGGNTFRRRRLSKKKRAQFLRRTKSNARKQ